MKEFVEYAVKELVDFPNEVDVRQIDGDRTIAFELRLNKTDIGKVIGKRGRTIQALRTLANSAVSKLGKRIMVEIIEEKGSDPSTEQPSALPAPDAVPAAPPPLSPPVSES